MFSADVAFDLSLLDQLQGAAVTLPDSIERFAKRELRPFVSHRVDLTLRREPPVRAFPEDYPIEWTSERQRRYVLGYVLERDEFGHIIPYERQHIYVRGWHVVGDYTGGLSSIRVFNDDPVAQFVGGRRQQYFHQVTGWPNAASTLQAISVDVNERIELGLPSVIDDALKGKRAA